MGDFTIRRGGLLNRSTEHKCDLPDPEAFIIGTQISCNECGKWWKRKQRSVDTYDPPGYRGHFWKRMRKRDR